MTKNHRYCVLALLASLGSLACETTPKEPSSKSFRLLFHASSDDGTPVVGAKFVANERPLGVSDAKGELPSTWQGIEGQSLKVTVRCPDGFVSPEEATNLKLAEVRRVNELATLPIELRATCSRKTREVVLVVRTNGAPVLPIDVGGKRMAQTDESGLAHLRLTVDRNERSLSVTLGTREQSSLLPQNPSRVFELDGQDAVLLFEQSFVPDRKVVAARRDVQPKPSRKIPYRISSARLLGY